MGIQFIVCKDMTAHQKQKNDNKTNVSHSMLSVLLADREILILYLGCSIQGIK